MKTFFTLFLIFLAFQNYAQNVGIGTLAPAPSAKLDISSINSGLLIPRISLLDVTNGLLPVASPATGLLVFNTNPVIVGGSGTGFYYWDGTVWRKFEDNPSNDWALLGNAGTNPATNFLGTTDAQSLVFRTNNTEHVRILTNGNVGFGTPTPSSRIEVNGWVGRTAHNNGGLVGSYNNVAPNDANTNPIYAIGSNYFPDVSTLNNFYGVGYTHTNASFITDPGPNSWGMYVAADGDARIFLGASAGGTSYFDAGNVGIGTQTPTDRLVVSNGRVEFTNTNDATGTAGSGVLEIGNTLRIDGNEVITNTGSVLYLNNDNDGDVRADGTTFGVDASANSVGIGTSVPNANSVLEVRSTTKGMLTPRLTTTQRDAMGGTLTEGLLIYNTTENCFQFWDTKAVPVTGNNGFWNSLCLWCENVVIVSANQTGFNLNTYIGNAKAEHYCVYVRPGVTLSAAANGGSGSAGNPGFNASTMPAGASVSLYNYGLIRAGGGDGGRGGRESDAVCQGDVNGQNGGRGGDAIQTSNLVQVAVFNYGTLRAGGGGGGGGGASCCSAGGGGGGGAGVPAGGSGGTQSCQCTSGFVCGCGTSTSGGGNGGTATTGGTGGGGVNRGATSCTCNGSGAGAGGTGGGNGLAGNIGGGTQRRGAGGAAGLAVRGNGSGSSLSNLGGTVVGGVQP